MQEQDTGVVIVHTTVENSACADALASALVKERLAACVQRCPVRSTYRWEGRIESADEVLLMIKTRTDMAERVVTRIRELHSYELPEVLVTRVSGGLPDYMQWVKDETVAE